MAKLYVMIFYLDFFFKLRDIKIKLKKMVHVMFLKSFSEHSRGVRVVTFNQLTRALETNVAVELEMEPEWDETLEARTNELDKIEKLAHSLTMNKNGLPFVCTFVFEYFYRKKSF